MANGANAPTADTEAEEAELFEQIGRLKRELEWLKKKLPPSADAKRPLVEPGHPDLTVRRQCELLGLARPSHYYQPASESPENLRLMRLIDEEYTAHPFSGSRKLTRRLVQQGESVNRKRVQRRGRCLDNVFVEWLWRSVNEKPQTDIAWGENRPYTQPHAAWASSSDISSARSISSRADSAISATAWSSSSTAANSAGIAFPQPGRSRRASGLPVGGHVRRRS